MTNVHKLGMTPDNTWLTYILPAATYTPTTHVKHAASSKLSGAYFPSNPQGQTTEKYIAGSSTLYYYNYVHFLYNKSLFPIISSHLNLYWKSLPCCNPECNKLHQFQVDFINFICCIVEIKEESTHSLIVVKAVIGPPHLTLLLLWHPFPSHLLCCRHGSIMHVAMIRTLT